MDTIWEISDVAGELREYAAEIVGGGPQWQINLKRVDTQAEYTVSCDRFKRWHCDCPDSKYWGFRKRNEPHCKHIAFVVEWVKEQKETVVNPRDANNATVEPELPVEHRKPLVNDYAPVTIGEAAQIAEFVAKSMLYPDIKNASAAFVKILVGREMGFGPAASLSGVYVVEGRAELGSHLKAAAIKRSPRHDYDIKEHSDLVCSIEFWEYTGVCTGKPGSDRKGRAGWKLCGGAPIRYTLAECIEKGWTVTNSGKEKPTWKKTPRNMLFARVIADGYRFHFPDLTGGVCSYDPDELDAISANGQTSRPLGVGGLLVGPPVDTVELPPPSQMVKDAQDELKRVDEQYQKAMEVNVPQSVSHADITQDIDPAQIDRINALETSLSMKPGQLRTRLQALYKVPAVANLTRSQADDLIGKMQAAVDKTQVQKSVIADAALNH